MMRLFKRHRPKHPDNPVSQWLGCQEERLRQAWVKTMERMTRRCSPFQLKLLVGTSTMAFSGYCLMLVINSAMPEDLPVMPLPKAVQLKQQDYDRQSGAGHAFNDPGAVRLLQKLDSLSRDPSGRSRYDSLLRARPGLGDTLRQLEMYYKPK